jgi:hypothetical protein
VSQKVTLEQISVREGLLRYHHHHYHYHHHPQHRHRHHHHHHRFYHREKEETLNDERERNTRLVASLEKLQREQEVLNA